MDHYYFKTLSYLVFYCWPRRGPSRDQLLNWGLIYRELLIKQNQIAFFGPKSSHYTNQKRQDRGHCHSYQLSSYDCQFGFSFFRELMSYYFSMIDERYQLDFCRNHANFQEQIHPSNQLQHYLMIFLLICLLNKISSFDILVTIY